MLPHANMVAKVVHFTDPFMHASANDPSALTPEQKRLLLAELLGNNEPELYPLTFAQQRILFLEQFEPGSGVHNLGSALVLSGHLDREALQRAFNAVIERHESLRTVFVMKDGEPRQQILPGIKNLIEYVDLRQLSKRDRDEKKNQVLSDVARRPFDLEKGPLIRLLLVQLADTEHILAYTAHHICTDGTSLGIFLQELEALYAADTTGTAVELPPLLIQYADYAEWQRSSSSEERDSVQIQYWKEQLAGIPSLLELPTDRTRPAEQTFEGRTVEIALPEDLSANASALAQREQATTFAVFLAAFAVLLQRYSGQEDICIGIPVAGRNQVETENLIGLLVNTVVIRVRLGENARFSDIVRQVQDSILAADANQDVPFERLVEELNPRRSLAYHPLFQVMVTAFSAALNKPYFGSMTADAYDVNIGRSAFDLTSLFIEDAAGRWWWNLTYNTSLFSQPRIERMLVHYQTLLASAAQDSSQPISRLPLLGAEEQRQISEWNNATAIEFPHACAHELIRATARRNPARTAVQFEDRSMTYAELDEASDRLARKLRAAGAIPGQLIGVCINRSIEMVTGLLAVLKTGCAYVPMDPEYPLQRLAYMMEDSGATVLLTERNLLPDLQAQAQSVVFVEDDPAAQEEPLALEESFDPESLAYVIYTSGSTGKPKGVAIPHRALVNLLCSMQREPGLTADDALLAVTTVCFDIAGLELFLPLLSGARIVIAGRETAVDGHALLQSFDRYGITVMQATPTTWRLLIEAGWDATKPVKVLCGGEALPAELARQLTARSSSIWNVYGPTETTIWSSCSQILPGESITIGKPIDNTQFYVLDKNFQQAPIGVPGELYIGGSGLAKGYWNRPELTKEKFVQVPGIAAGATLYRTGDEVRLLDNGNYEYHRRIDFQVKVRGFRIELGEIETALTKVNGVRQAVVTVREDTPGDTRLIGYVVLKDGVVLTAADIQQELKRTLPDFMVPFLMMMDSLPLTSNGKVDRKQLPAPDAVAVTREVLAPRNEIEAKLTHIWQEALRLPAVGVRDDFFDLGGHSLLAVRVLSRIKDEFGVALPLATLFHEPTVEYLARMISDRQKSSEPALNMIPIQTGGSKPPFFVGGSNPAYVQLAEILGTDQPVYKMDLYALTEGLVLAGKQPYTSFSDYVAEFIAGMRKVQPTGPYYLGGGCDGGVLALEIARQLQKQGETVGLLLIWETPRTGFFERNMFKSALHFAKRATQSFASGDLPSVIRERLLNQTETAAPLTEEQQQHLYIFDSFWEAIQKFHNPDKFQGRIQFIRTEKQYEHYHDTSYGWNELATDGIELHTVPGDHGSYFKEHMNVFGETVRQLLVMSQSAAEAVTAAR
jgi:amino acid adenylation domain-containing protein